MTKTPPTTSHHFVRPVSLPKSGHDVGLTAWFTGISGAGKTTLSNALVGKLKREGIRACVIDGDDLRSGLSQDLGFTLADRSENVRRAAEVARLLNNQGVFVAVAMISPLLEHRQQARSIIGEERFFEVYMKSDVERCAKADCKGLYARALRGDIADFTGVSSLYEAPKSGALGIDTATCDVSTGVNLVLKFMSIHAHVCGMDVNS